jgi:hypothetical protein
MERRVDALVGSLTDREAEKILSEEAERQITERIHHTIEDNFTRIRSEVQKIVDRLLPEGGDSSGAPELEQEPFTLQ